MPVVNKVLDKMLERLLASLTSGPSLNCRPHSSRQRVDFTSLSRLGDLSADEALHRLLGHERDVKLTARVPAPNRVGLFRKRAARRGGEDPAEQADEAAAEERGPSPEERAWLDQNALLTKLRIIADDARTYEQDTGVHVLNLGFPLLSIPPGALGARGARGGAVTRRVLAPLAFVPVSVTLAGGVAQSVRLACRGEGLDLVVPNLALLAWLEQQTGKAAEGLFDDDTGDDPWREIGSVVRHVCETLQITVPSEFEPPEPPNEAGPADSAAPEAGARQRGMKTALDEEAEADLHAAASEDSASELPPAPDPSQSDGPEASRRPRPEATQPQYQLASCPRSDSDEAEKKPTILTSAVIGLFPIANQGLLRDMQAMAAGEGLQGPVMSFIEAGVSFEDAATDTPPPSAPRDERLVAAADPCQARAVRLARQSRGLVVHGPPGTGKSQTITNIISDHLARGQRVLFVCDKRTALDVVADRLDHMGLGQLCAIIHDPQRDQRDLYMDVRQQLDDLSDVKLNPRAEKELARVDEELAALHAELIRRHQALMTPDAQTDTSFHDLVGRWLATEAGEAVGLDKRHADRVTLDQAQRFEQAVDDLLEQAIQVGYPANPWKEAAGGELAALLGRAMNETRAAAAACVAAAEKADATIDPAIPPFPAAARDLPAMGAARAALGDRFAAVLTVAEPVVRARWAAQPADAAERARKRLADAATFRRILADLPLDPELKLAAAGMPPGQSNTQDLAALAAYIDIADKWYALFSFGVKNAAARVLNRFGLTRSGESARRLHTFLTAQRARVALTALHQELMGLPSTPRAAMEDEALTAALGSHETVLNLLDAVRKDPLLADLSTPVAAALGDAQLAATLMAGLAKSPARAGAIAALERAMEGAKLFAPQWLASFSGKVREGAAALSLVQALHDRIDTLEGVLRVREGLARLPEDLKPAAEQMVEQSVEAAPGIVALRRAALASEITRRLREDPELLKIDAQRMKSSFERYRAALDTRRTAVRNTILHLWRSKQQERLLAATGSRLNGNGAALRRRLTTRGEKAMRLRQVLAVGRGAEGGDPLLDLRPVWMASPETVAQIFPREAVFDVVVFDEASQCRLEEALPVLLRGRRVTIAGDPKQLPPTRFFESSVSASDTDDDVITDDQQLFELQQGETEDLLSAALGLDIQQCYLDVHYRSRNADLIEFSNDHFYGSRLQAIPGHPRNRPLFPPLTLYRVGGTYEKRVNEAEAQKVCEIVRDLLKRSSPPSIGIACFNLQQRDLIVEALDEMAEEDKAFARRLAEARGRKGAGSFEGLFVKNLENVQGDERDHIIISTTYGPDAKGRFYRRFGPVGRAGGGRRLNVLVTRSRQEVHLVTSIPGEVYRSLPPIPAGQTPGGGYLLFAYLQYAEALDAAYNSVRQAEAGADGAAQSRGGPQADAPEEVATTQAASPAAPVVQERPTRVPSELARSLASSLAEKHGVGSDVHWGNDGFCIDVALHHAQRPGDVTVGVLCDGTRFSASEDPVEWDVFRTGMLEAQGWRLHRLWSPHFFRDPGGSIDQILRDAHEIAAGEDNKDSIRVRRERDA